MLIVCIDLGLSATATAVNFLLGEKLLEKHCLKCLDLLNNSGVLFNTSMQD